MVTTPMVTNYATVSTDPQWFLRATSNTTYTLIHSTLWFATLGDAIANLVASVEALNVALERLDAS